MIYDWYKTKSLGEVATIKEKYGCVWCPECGGSGRKQFGGFLKKEIICPRCNGRMIVAARKITDKELWVISGYEHNKVTAVRQHPGSRRDNYREFIEREAKQDTTPPISLKNCLEQLEEILHQESLAAELESSQYMMGSGQWAYAKGEHRAYERCIFKIQKMERLLQTGRIQGDHTPLYDELMKNRNAPSRDIEEVFAELGIEEDD